MRSFIISSTLAATAVCFAPEAFAQPAPTATLATTPTKMRGRPPEEFKFMTQADVTKAAYRPGPVNSTVVSDHENYWIEFVKRGDTGNRVEAHNHWVDYITVLAGEGTLTYGGTVANPNMTNPNEPRGETTMTGGTKIMLHPGDYLVLPAGMWHIFGGTPGNTLSYVIFKARQ
jgi:quercetin dioxygenase-like cupin family protein